MAMPSSRNSASGSKTDWVVRDAAGRGVGGPDTPIKTVVEGSPHEGLDAGLNDFHQPAAGGPM